jgi:hypothetical protein
MPLSSLLVQYMNWADRFVPPRPRKVFAWETFTRWGNGSRHLAAVSELKTRIIAGEDLRPFLSEQITQYGYVQSKIGKDGKKRGPEWGDKDYALNAYGVHHLHLGRKIRPDGWSERTKELLYVTFDRKHAGFLMVGNHASFDDGSLGQALAEAQVAAGGAIKGIIGPARVFTPKERNLLHRHGISTFAQVGDKTVMSGMLSSAGTSIHHTSHAQRIMRMLEFYEPLLDDPMTSQAWFEAASRTQPTAPELSWRLHYGDLGVYEAKTRAFFLILGWCR